MLVVEGKEECGKVGSRNMHVRSDQRNHNLAGASDDPEKKMYAEAYNDTRAWYGKRNGEAGCDVCAWHRQ